MDDKTLAEDANLRRCECRKPFEQHGLYISLIFPIVVSVHGRLLLLPIIRGATGGTSFAIPDVRVEYGRDDF